MADNDNNKSNHSPEDEENKNYDSSRRNFIKNSGVAAGGVVGGGVLVSLLGNPFKTEEASTDKEGKVDYSETRMFFDREADFKVLSQAVERIFPEDDDGPGAIELGVPYYIDQQLAGPWGKNTKMYMKKPFRKGETPLTKGEMFLQGVRKIEDVSQKEYDEKFIDLEEDEQNNILESFEKDEVKMKHVTSAVFFSTLIQSTLEGAYSDPMYGGNKDMKGWAMKEYPGPRMSMKDNIEDEFEVFAKMKRKSLKTHM